GLGLGRQEEIDWRDVITEAEQIVGYPTSFLNLRWLFNDEIASTAIHLLLKSAKNLLVGSKSNLQSVGLIILLVSKAAGFDTTKFLRDQYDSGVLHSQRALAEIVEMKRTAKDEEAYYDWENEDNLQPLGSNDFLGRGIAEWKLRTMLMSGSILAKGCQGAMKLANRGPEMEKNAYILGGHLALLWQLYLDVKDFFTHPYSYSLVGAPTTIALWEYPQIYAHIFESKVEKTPVEFKQLHYSVRSTRSMDYLIKLLDDEFESVLKYAKKFPGEDASAALQKMAITIHGETLQYIE
ncbi:hypothetical protein HF086_009636, partial [Spodoptera exigua]